MITESNEDIKSLVKHLDGLVIKFRNKYPEKKLNLLHIRDFYSTFVVPWMENYVLKGKDIEEDKEEDEELKNQIIEMIDNITRMLKQ